MTSIEPDHVPKVPRRDELVARARDLAPIVAKNAARGEEARRVVDESIEALSEAGMFKLAVPRRYGGYETDMRTMLEASAAVAEADGGTGWVVALLNVCAWAVGLYPQAAQDEVFGKDPNAKVSGIGATTGTARRVDDGFKISGRWHYNSGAWHSSWAQVGIPLADEQGTVVDKGMALIPCGDYSVEDTWFVAGMRSTGSNCIVVDDVFVPDHRVLRMKAAIQGGYPTEHQRETLFRSALVPSIALSLVGPHLGLGRAALDSVRENAARKPISYTRYGRQDSSTAFQLRIARAAMKIDTATLHAHRVADTIDSHAAQGGYPDYATRARLRADTAWATEFIVDAINDLLFAHGAAGFAESSPLQRMWRDANVAARHALLTPDIGYEVLGKSLLNVDEAVTPLV